MTNLLWPGNHRAGELMTDRALLESMAAVESAWLQALGVAGLAPAEVAGADLRRLVGSQDGERLALSAEDGGNPVIGLVALLRERADPPVSRWIHRGLTSRDVLDTALMLSVRDVVDHLGRQLAEQVSALSGLGETHRSTSMAPTTVGAKAPGWLNGVVDATAQLAALSTPAQIGGPGGTLVATTELATLLAGRVSPAQVSVQLVRTTAGALGLAVRMPWRTTRAPVTAAGDAFVGCTDAWGRIGSDVVTLARPEIAELAATLHTAALVETPPSPTYFGAVDALIDASLDRARWILEEHR